MVLPRDVLFDCRNPGMIEEIECEIKLRKDGLNVDKKIEIFAEIWYDNEWGISITK